MNWRFRESDMKLDISSPPLFWTWVSIKDIKRNYDMRRSINAMSQRFRVNVHPELFPYQVVHSRPYYNTMNSYSVLVSNTFSIYDKYRILLFTFWGYNSKIDIEKTSIYECGFSRILNQEAHSI
jgi:hypothetical protein